MPSLYRFVSKPLFPVACEKIIFDGNLCYRPERNQQRPPSSSRNIHRWGPFVAGAPQDDSENCRGRCEHRPLWNLRASMPGHFTMRFRSFLRNAEDGVPYGGKRGYATVGTAVLSGPCGISGFDARSFHNWFSMVFSGTPRTAFPTVENLIMRP